MTNVLLKKSDVIIPNSLLPLPEHLPNFFILGGPKCGTTSLFSWLQDHPETYLPAKEPNFLSRDVYDPVEVPGALRDWEAYLGCLAPADQAQKCTGESTPRYLYSDIALQVLSQHVSKPQIMVILRNPIDLVYSLHGQMIKQGVETELDFGRAWARAMARGDDAEKWRNSAGHIDRRLDYPLYGRLGARLEQVVRMFQADRLKVMVLEEGLSKTPDIELSGVLEFLGLPHANIDTNRRNERTEIRAVALHRAIIHLRYQIEKLSGKMGIDVTPSNRRGRGTGLFRLINRLNNVKPKKKVSLEAGQRKDLADYFEQDVGLVQQTLGRHLPEWEDWPDLRGPKGS